jgi:hypothetical protein
MADLADIWIVDLVGEDSVLGLLMKGQIEPTAMYGALDDFIAEWKPTIVILDTCGHVFRRGKQPAASTAIHRLAEKAGA